MTLKVEILKGSPEDSDP